MVQLDFIPAFLNPDAEEEISILMQRTKCSIALAKEKAFSACTSSEEGYLWTEASPKFME